MSRIGGIKARSNGWYFEALIDVACRQYQSLGIAYIDKNAEPMKPIRPLKNGQFVACYTQKAQPDYKGVLKGGKCVVFEAKHTASGRIGQERVTWAQWEALDFYSKLGAECFVLISLNFRTFYRVPWPVWRDINHIFGKKSVNAADLETYKLRDIMHFLDGLV